MNVNILKKLHGSRQDFKENFLDEVAIEELLKKFYLRNSRGAGGLGEERKLGETASAKALWQRFHGNW